MRSRKDGREIKVSKQPKVKEKGPFRKVSIGKINHACKMRFVQKVDTQYEK